MSIEKNSRISGSVCVSLATCAIALMYIPTPSAAQDKPFKFEVTPFAGYRMGGSFSEKDGDGRVELNDSDSQGIMLNIKANPKGQYELLYARQNTDARTEGFLAGDPTIEMDVEYFHFGGTYLFDGENTRPFIALTIGMSLFDPQLLDTGSESFFSASLGGGVQLNASKRFGVRLEARVFTTFVDNDSNIFCSSNGGSGACLIEVDARTFTQWEARAGLVFRF